MSAESVVHIRYSSDSIRPWQGIGPLSRAETTRNLAGRLESLLASEAKRGGHVLPLPKVTEEEDSLKVDLKKFTGWAGLG